MEQARGDTHNMVAVVMRRHGCELQAAVDYVGGLTNASIARFEEIRRGLPSWGETIDRNVALYVQGLQDWMVGALEWSFDSARYFGNDGAAVKQHRVVILRPPPSGTGRNLPSDALAHSGWADFLMRCACIPARVPRPRGSCLSSSGSHPSVRTRQDV